MPPSDRDIHAARTIEPEFLERVAKRVDVSQRSDLRRRLADALESALRERGLNTAVMLPSTRKLSAGLGIHRKTVTAALELLTERAVVERRLNGRYVAVASHATAIESASTDDLTRRAANAAVIARMSESEFRKLAVDSYRRASMGSRQVVFVQPTEHIPGIAPGDLARALDWPVSVEPIERLVPQADMILVATSTDADAVRARLNGQADVFAVGLTFDTDLRLATTDLKRGAHVSILAPNEGVLMAVLRRVTSMRQDLTLIPHVGLFRDVDGDSTAILAPDGLSLPSIDVPVFRYRCFISPAEVRMLASRLHALAAAPLKRDPVLREPGSRTC